MRSSDSDAAWQKWGEIDPYFGVSSSPMFRRDALDRHREAFFASGEDYVDARLEAARRLFDFRPHGLALDFGCGVGRLALPMARHFHRVIGLDIASAMLAEARRNAGERGITNVSFQSSDTIDEVAFGSCAFVNSYIVLQHIPVKRGIAYIDRLLGLVEPGGVAALHVSLSRRMGHVRNALYLGKRYVPGVLGAVNLARGRRHDEPLMQMNTYSLEDILILAEGKGFAEAVVETEVHFGVLTARLLWRRHR